MNIAICDDDESSVNQIMQLLKPYQGTMNLSINTYSSGEAFIEKMVEFPLADLILKKKISFDNEVNVSLHENKLSFNVKR